MKKILVFCIPLAYTWVSRYGRENPIRGVIAFISKLIIPTFLFAYFHENFTFDHYCWGIFYLYSIYEIGYIQNDCETIKIENNPTIRIDQLLLFFYYKYTLYIYLWRVIVILFSFSFLYNRGINLSVLLYSLGVLPVFCLYNRIRNRWNLELHLVLMFFRYSIPAFVAVNAFHFDIAVGLLLFYPIPIYIELSVKGKFGYKNKYFQYLFLNDYSKFHHFRVKYYFFVLICYILGALSNIVSFSQILPWIWYFLFCTISFKKSKKQLGDLNATF